MYEEHHDIILRPNPQELEKPHKPQKQHLAEAQNNKNILVSNKSPVVLWIIVCVKPLYKKQIYNEHKFVHLRSKKNALWIRGSHLEQQKHSATDPAKWTALTCFDSL